MNRLTQRQKEALIRLWHEGQKRNAVLEERLVLGIPISMRGILRALCHGGDLHHIVRVCGAGQISASKASELMRDWLMLLPVDLPPLVVEPVAKTSRSKGKRSAMATNAGSRSSTRT